MNKYQLQLISSLIYVLFTTSSLTGQSCTNLVEHINSQVQGIIAGTETSNAIYASYNSTDNSTWSTQNWTEQVDFSGVAFDANQTCTLISPRHVLMATHYQRGVGSTVVFHDSTGGVHTATLIAKQSVPGGLNPDITVGLLDIDVPVKYYKVLPPQTDWIPFLDSALVVSTHHTRNASLREVRSTSGLFIRFRQSSIVPTSYYAPAVSGNSGNPSFLLINGEPILIETFTYGGWGSGPFFSEPNNFNAINSIMTSLGGGYQLETIKMCIRPGCPPDSTLDLVISEACINENFVVLNGGSPAGGSYSGTGVFGNTFYPNFAGVGNHLITYTYTSSEKCIIRDTASFTVHDLPSVSLNLDLSEACINESPIILSGGSPTGGFYTGSGTGVGGNTFNPMMAGIGDHLITYTYTDVEHCMNSDTATATFTVHDLPSVSLNLGISEACINETNIILSGENPTGGSYSGTGVSGNTFNPMMAGIGDHLITYSYTDANNCMSSATAIFSVHNFSPAHDSLEITNTIPDSTYEAKKKIRSTGTVVSGSTVNFQAGQCIVLSPNFTVSAGAAFTAKILTSSCSSSSAITPIIPQTNQVKLLTKTEAIIEPTLTISPNPFSSEAKIEIDLLDKDIVNIIVLDQTGRPIKVLAQNQLLEAGTHTFHLKEERLPNGLLYISMMTSKTHQVKKAILIH